MKVLEWKKMLGKLNDDDDLCIAKCSRDYGVVYIDYDEPSIDKREDIHSSFYVKEVNNGIDEKCDYVIY